MMNNSFNPRPCAFPALTWGTLDIKTCSYLETKSGSKLLTDGWWQFARKIHYTADLVMSLSWGLATGFDSTVPYFYFVFFVFVLVHRTSRDLEKCREKYKGDWDEYCRRVKYTFIPYIY